MLYRTQKTREYPTHSRGNVRVNSAALSDQGSGGGHRSLQLVPLTSSSHGGNGGSSRLVKSGSLTSMGSTVRRLSRRLAIKLDYLLATF